MIKIEDITLTQFNAIASLVGVEQARELISMLSAPTATRFSSHSGGSEAPWKIGTYYLIRTVTMIQTGKCVAVYPQEICLSEAAWIADTGRFSDALISLDFNEVEPFPEGTIIVGRGSIVDAVEITKSPRVKK